MRLQAILSFIHILILTALWRRIILS